MTKMKGTNHLTDILDIVAKKGMHREPLLTLTNVFPRGEDSRQQIKDWAEQNHVAVVIDETQQICVFYTARQAPQK